MLTFDESERARWAGAADPYAKTFALLCGHTADALLAAANVAPGESVLDVGTGTGTVAARAAELGARVTAVDAEPSMVAATARRVPRAEVRRAILPDLPFAPSTFDAVLANFVINHVGDPGATVAALADVTRPGGRVAMTLWPKPTPPAQALWSEVFAAAGVPATGLPGVEADKNFARTPDGMLGLLTAAGLVDASCRAVDWVHETTDEAWWGGAAAGLSAPGQLLIRQTDEVRRRLRAEFDRVVERYRIGPGRLGLPTGALLAVATKPST